MSASASVNTPDPDKINTRKVQILKTFTNQIMIGRIQEFHDGATIYKPYSVVPTSDGIQIYPLDMEIIGKEIPEITIDQVNIFYITGCAQELENLYLQEISGIETPKPEIIV